MRISIRFLLAFLTTCVACFEGDYDSEAEALRILENHLNERLVGFADNVGTRAFSGEELARTNRSVVGEKPSNVSTGEPERLKEAQNILGGLADNGNVEAHYLLARLYLYGTKNFPRNLSASFEHYKKHADLTGDSGSQFMVGVGYSTGLFGNVPIDQISANLYYTFAAYGGDLRAKMAMGYRYYNGIGVSTDFDKSSEFYREAALASVNYYLDGPGPLGRRHITRNAWVIPEELYGGIYGDGASSVSSGWLGKLRRGKFDFNSEAEKDILKFKVEEGGSEAIYACYALSYIYYHGGVNSSPKYTLSFLFARMATLLVWSNDSIEDDSYYNTLSKEIQQAAAACAGISGLRYIRGEGTYQNVKEGLKWINKSAELGFSDSIATLGECYLKGVEVEQNITEAVMLFNKSDGSNTIGADSWASLVEYYYKQGDYESAMSTAIKTFPSASLVTYFYVGEIFSKHPEVRESHKNLQTSEPVRYYKASAEKADELLSPLRWAQKCYNEGDVESASIGFLIAAEEGYASAQVNIAYLLDGDKSYLKLLKISSNEKFVPLHGSSLGTNLSDTSVIYWSRAASQGNEDSLLKLADHYIAGDGVVKDPAMAAVLYEQAADQGNAQAQWNLGWLHENGIGMEKDFHLARRYYDLALQSAPEAYLPVKLSLSLLCLKSIWYSLIHSDVRGIKEPAEAQSSKWSLGSLQDELRHSFERFSEWADGRARERLQAAEELNEDIKVLNSDRWNMFDEDNEFADDFDDGLGFLDIILLLAVIGIYILAKLRARQLAARRNLGRQGQQVQQAQRAQTEAHESPQAQAQEPSQDRNESDQEEDPANDLHRVNQYFQDHDP